MGGVDVVVIDVAVTDDDLFVVGEGGGGCLCDGVVSDSVSTSVGGGGCPRGSLTDPDRAAIYHY